MKTWTKTFAIAVTSIALVCVGAAVSAGTGSAQTPATGTAAAAAPPGQTPRIRPAIINDNAPDETIFVPIVPCRAVDTRHGGGRITNGATRSFQIEGAGSFTSQGGPTAGCGIPNNATALAVVISAVNASALGYFKAYPTGTPAPNSSILDYAAKTTSSGATVTITPNVVKGLTFFNFGGPTDITVDVTGYYQQEIEADILSSGTLFANSNRVLEVTHTAGTGFYVVTVDRPVEGSCAAVASSTLTGYLTKVITEASGTIDVQIYHFVGGVVTNSDAEFNLVASC